MNQPIEQTTEEFRCEECKAVFTHTEVGIISCPKCSNTSSIYVTRRVPKPKGYPVLWNITD